MTQPHVNPPGAAAPPKRPGPAAWILAGCAVIVIVGGIVVCGVVWWGYHEAKGYAQRALETNGGGMKSVAQLWADVPPLEGSTLSQQAQMPLAMRALARPFLDTMMKGLNDGKDAGHWDVAFMTSSGKTIRDVESFYVADRMSKYGWQKQGGCANLSETTFCSFQKEQGGSKAGLLIIAADDPATKSTALYFIRQNAQEQSKANAASGQ